MRKAPLSAVQASLPKYIKSSATSPLLITNGGEPVAMLVGLGGRGKQKRPTKLKDVLREAWQEYQKHDGMTHDEFWSDMAKHAG